MERDTFRDAIQMIKLLNISIYVKITARRTKYSFKPTVSSYFCEI